MIGQELVRTDVPFVSAEDTLDKILEIFSTLDVNSLPVVDKADPQYYVGMVTRAALMRRYMDELQKSG